LSAAQNTATGKVIGRLSAQHRAVDFRDFLDQIDQQTKPGPARTARWRLRCWLLPERA
jgi:hypothetical protein